ncbi:MAG: rhomboid family intramembrane serine protease [Caldilineaceae bacterium]
MWGSVASYAFSDALSAGASGAIFGLAGATTIYFLRYRENFGARRDRAKHVGRNWDQPCLWDEYGGN